MAVGTTTTGLASWDRRAWLIGLIGSSVLLGIGLVSMSSPVAAWLSTVCPVTLWGDDAGRLLADGTSIVTVLFLPGTLTVLARRRAFLWGALPILLALVFTALGEVLRHEWTGLRYLVGWEELLPSLAAWFVSSGVGLAARGLKNRRRQKAAKTAAAADEDRSRIWPPEPLRGAARTEQPESDEAGAEKMRGV